MATSIFRSALLLAALWHSEVQAFVTKSPAATALLKKSHGSSNLAIIGNPHDRPMILHHNPVTSSSLFLPTTSSTSTASFTTLQLFPETSLLATDLDIDVIDGVTNSPLQSLAETLGLVLGGASLLLYTPIAIRIIRQKSADGLTISTWWLKLTSYTCTDVYNIKKGFPLSAFSEVLVITIEAVVILSLVSYYQNRVNGGTLALSVVYLSITAWALFSPENASWGPSDEVFALAQVAATLLNTFALIPQLWQNYQRKSSGDYSAVTSTLATGGCLIRLFTTVELADGDALLLLNYGVALLLNLSVLVQILWFGTKEEGKSVVSLYLADVKSS